MRRFRVALGQINATVGDLEQNVRLIVHGIERARVLGCSLVAFPELAITGYPPEDLLFKPAFIEANLRALDAVTQASRGLAFEEDFVVADLDLEAVFRARLHDSRRRKEKLGVAPSRRVVLPAVAPSATAPLPPRPSVTPLP